MRTTADTDQIAQRLARLRASMLTSSLEAVVVYAKGEGESAGIVRYLTGWMPLSSEAILVVPGDGVPVLVSADKNRARAFAQYIGGATRVVKTTALVPAFASELAALVPAGARIGVAGTADLTVGRSAEFLGALNAYESSSADALTTELRSHRTGFEVERQIGATRVADAMVQHAMRTATVPGVTGADVMAEVEYLGRRLGAERASCWLAIGDRPAETYFDLFELATSIEAGERIQIGTTVLYDGCFSQVLRIGVLGTPSARLLDVADRLIELQDASLAVMRPGNRVHLIDDVLDGGIDELCPYPRPEDPFRFQACHAMSCSYSEPWSAPFLSPDRNREADDQSPLIEPNQVYEIHPNFTLPDLGHVCAGDVALVTPDGGTWLSQTPRGILRLG